MNPCGCLPFLTKPVREQKDEGDEKKVAPVAPSPDVTEVSLTSS